MVAIEAIAATNQAKNAAFTVLTAQLRPLAMAGEVTP
jgi:hypothetical protein